MIRCADTITKLPPEADGAVVVSGSHGGRYPGYLAARAGVRAVILNDAGVGLQEAGIGALPYLDALGIAAATVSYLSCRMGDAGDMLAGGKISFANGPARAVGIAPGQNCAVAAELLQRVPHRRADPPPIGEARGEISVGGGGRRIVLLDSASLVREEDTGQIIVTGSHGGLIGGDPARALAVAGYAAVFNDAGGAATGRLPALQARGIAALTVAAGSARIGEAASSFHDGVISAVNGLAGEWGAVVGAPAGECLIGWARRAVG